MRIQLETLRDFLIDGGLLTLKDFKDIQKESGDDLEKIEEALVQKGIVSESNLTQIKGHIAGVPFIDLERTVIDPNTLKLIPEANAKSLEMIAYRRKGDMLEVAMVEPDNLQAIDFIKKKTGLEVVPRLTSKASLESALRQYQESLQEEFSQIVSEISKDSPAESFKIKADDKGEKAEISAKDLKEIAEKLPIIQVVDSLLSHAMVQNASDIHIEPLEQAVVVRYRIDGILRDVMTLPHQVHPALVARIKVLSNLKLDEHRLPQDGRFKVESDEYKFSIRVSIIPVMDGEKIVMRLLREESVGLTLESLGLQGKGLDILRRSIKKPNGMILVTGPTGSGKTTTLYAVMDILNTKDVNIATIEDPIEYRMPRINQTQVKPQIGLTFASGLRSLVRQDPDIIMVGEIRDNETASLAVNAALTGHLVLSTLHTNSAAGAIPRLIDMKVEPFLLSSTINVIVAQRLVRKLCPDAREEYKLLPDQRASLEKEFDIKRILEVLRREKAVDPRADWDTVPFYHPKATKDCPEGYKGRLGIFEVLDVSEQIKRLITSPATSDDVQHEAVKEGMMTMVEDGFVKAARGLTTIEEVLRVSKE